MILPKVQISRNLVGAYLFHTGRQTDEEIVSHIAENKFLLRYETTHRLYSQAKQW